MTKKSARGLLAATYVFTASVGLLGHCSPTTAQVAKPGDEMRTLFVTPDDIGDGKRLAELSCATCHGRNGVSSTEGVPHLAGQRAPYVYLELKAYQSGLRENGPMSDSVKFLSDDALVKVAAYFASLDPAPSDPAGAESVTTTDPVEAGKTAATPCAGCHGETGVSNTPGMPSLTGLDPQYLVMAMNSYRSSRRREAVMKAMLAALNDSDVRQIALFYALQAPAPARTSARGDAQAGKTAAASCAGCHGDQGVSGNPATPSLAGQDAQYFAAALHAYRDGARSDETMKALAAGLDENTINNLAAYYAGLQPQPLNIRRPLSAQQWAQRCDRCHGLDGNSTNPRFPALAGQRADYLVKVLQAYKARARRSPEMAAMSDALTEDDIRNLAAHYSRQKARAVVFVTVPSK
jgi:cytochrome c553